MEGNKRKQNGITLIALIITIIVMLMLVGVTINVALNGGLFTQAEDATTGTEKQSIYEQIVSAMKIGDNGTIDVKGTYKSAKETLTAQGKTVTLKEPTDIEKITTSVIFTVTGKYGTYKYQITGTEIKLIEEKETEKEPEKETEEDVVPDELEKYIMGANKTGRTLFCSYDEEGNCLEGIFDFAMATFVQDPSNENSTIHELVKLGTSSSEMVVCVRYKRNLYTFEVDEDYCSVEGTLKKIYTPEGNLGKYVKYKELTWIVLYETNEKMELISADALGTVTLGDGDERALENIQVTDKDNLTDEEKFNVAVWSYNNLIETLTLKCKELTGIDENIRNVGGKLEDDDANLTDVNLEYLLSNGFELIDGYETEMETLLNGIKREINNNFENDNEQMNKLGITLADNSKGYLLNGRKLGCSKSWTFLRVQQISGSIIDYANEDLVRFNTSALYTTWSDDYNVRPVISLNKSLLNNGLGVGTIDDPVIISD